MFDAEQFLTENFKNAAGLVAFLRAYGAEPLPKEDAVMKWFQRKSVPSEWLPVLVSYLEIDRGRPVSLVPYLGEG